MASKGDSHAFPVQRTVRPRQDTSQTLALLQHNGVRARGSARLPQNLAERNTGKNRAFPLFYRTTPSGMSTFNACSSDLTRQGAGGPDFQVPDAFPALGQVQRSRSNSQMRALLHLPRGSAGRSPFIAGRDVTSAQILTTGSGSEKWQPGDMAGTNHGVLALSTGSATSSFPNGP
jgi:hypothetical protein